MDAIKTVFATYGTLLKIVINEQPTGWQVSLEGRGGGGATMRGTVRGCGRGVLCLVGQV